MSTYVVLDKPLDLDDFESNPRQYIMSLIGKEEYVSPYDFVMDMIQLFSEDELRSLLMRLNHDPSSF